MTPTLVSQPAPLRSASSVTPRVDSELRLSLHPVLERSAVVNGAWWPYSRDAAAELPDLIAAVDQRLQRTTLLVGVHRDAWRRVPCRIPARGRTVRIGGFRHGDPHVIVLFFASDEPVALLIIPPDTAVGPAEAALELTAQNTADLTGDAIFALAHLPSDPALRATADSMARWESESGSVSGQEARYSIRRPSAPA
ncbi:DUF5994 family protein [Nonomuraea sp. NPDC052116]|uniref:DUF5994 family protein n=1 Tax=Nonomuraea sp. NPDC052116 TaxID=3155665 RepID=UPI00342EF097